MKLTLEPADIASAKIDKIEVKHASIEEVIKQHIRDGKTSFKYINYHQLPVLFEGFIWKMDNNRTMIAIRGDNLNFQIVIVKCDLPKFVSNMQAMRQFIMVPKIYAKRTEESIRLTKTVNNTEAEITLNAEIIC